MDGVGKWVCEKGNWFVEARLDHGKWVVLWLGWPIVMVFLG